MAGQESVLFVVVLEDAREAKEEAERGAEEREGVEPRRKDPKSAPRDATADAAVSEVEVVLKGE